jgi:hypothetical protein
MGPDSGGYRLLTKNGLNVAGIGPLTGGSPSWTTYFAVSDIGACAARVTELGGTLVVPPMDLPNDSGRIAFAFDPTGGFFALFEAGANHIGAELVNEPGTVVWSELGTRDPDRATAFYDALLGWTTVTMPEMDYRTLNVSGRAVAGVMTMGEGYPPDLPTHWLTYFAVEDTSATVDRCRELGGSVMNGPMDTPIGPIAVLADPTGAVFAVGAFREIDDPNDWPA